MNTGKNQTKEQPEWEPADNFRLQKLLSETHDSTCMTFNFNGDHNSIAPNAISIQHIYGDALAQAALNRREAQTIRDMSRNEKRLFMYLGTVGDTLACISMLECCEEVSEVAMVAVGLVKRGVLPASMVRKSDFVERLLPFCPDIRHLNAANVNAHINRLLRQLEAASDEVESHEFEEGEVK